MNLIEDWEGLEPDDPKGTKKKIAFYVPESLFGEFFKMFPEQGERGAFLRTVVKYAVRYRHKKDAFIIGLLGLGEEE